MARRRKWPPTIHNRDGSDWIYIYDRQPNGTDKRIPHILGPTGSVESQQEYARVLSEHARIGTIKHKRKENPRTVAHVLDLHIEWTKTYHIHSQQFRIERACKAAKALYGYMPVIEFGPLAFKTVRQSLVEQGLARTYVNMLCNCLRGAFKWAAGEELAPPRIHSALMKVTNLRKGKTAAIESPKVRPVALDLVEKTLPGLRPIHRLMVQLQLVTGMRPGELVVMRPLDIKKDWMVVDGKPVWLYSPESHKREWASERRDIPLGSKAQALLEDLLGTHEPNEYLFCPRKAREDWEAEKRTNRKSKVQPSQEDRSKANPRKQAGAKYTSGSYRQAIHRACDLLKLERWNPHQLRHRAGTEIRKHFDLDHARAMLGHSNTQMTEHYAESLEKAALVAAKMG